MPSPTRMWLAAGLLAASHQSEEVAFSMSTWLDSHETTTLPWLDRHISRAPLASKSFAPRALVVLGQAAGFIAVAAWASKSSKLSKALTSAVTIGFAGAFAGHLVVAWRARSFAPGTATSLIPGIPGAILVLRYIHSEDHDSAGDSAE